MAARLVISPVVPSISDAFAVPNGAIGLALTGMWLGYALSQFPSGLLADRYGERSIILVAVGGTAVASTLLAFASSYAMFLVGTAVLGTVAGLHYSVATSLLTRTTDQIGTAIGIHTAGAPVAGVLAPMAAGAVGAWMGWRWAVALGTAFAVPVVGLVVYVVRARPPVRPNESVWGRFKIGPLADLLRRPPIARTVILSAVGMFVWQATASFLPTFFVAYHGYSEATAGALFSAYFLVQGATQPGLGALSDRIGRDLAASLSIGVGIVGYGLLVMGTGLSMAAVAVACAGLSMGWGAALMPKFMDHLDEHERSAGFGLVRTVYMVLGASGSVVTGFVADVFGWGVAFLVLVLLLVGMLGALVQSTWRDQVARRAHAAS
jgi:MFS family permease